MAYPARYTPTLKEIADGCRRIRAAWDDTEQMRRVAPVDLPQAFEVPVIHLTDQLRSELPSDEWS